MNIGDVADMGMNLLRGPIGSFGDLTFEVYAGRLLDSPLGSALAKVGQALIPDPTIKGMLGKMSQTRVMTFNDWQRRTRARYARHELINRKSVLEKVGEEPETITLTIKMAQGLVESPEEEAVRIRLYISQGHEDYLVLGNVVIGQFVITEMEERLEAVDCFGRVLASVMTVTFEEAVADEV